MDSSVVWSDDGATIVGGVGEVASAGGITTGGAGMWRGV